MSENDLLHEIYTKVTHISERLEVHLAEEEEMMPHLKELISMLHMSKGALILVKVMVFIIAPLVGAAAWVKAHVNL